MRQLRPIAARLISACLSILLTASGQYARASETNLPADNPPPRSPAPLPQGGLRLPLTPAGGEVTPSPVPDGFKHAADAALTGPVEQPVHGPQVEAGAAIAAPALALEDRAEIHLAPIEAVGHIGNVRRVERHLKALVDFMRPAKTPEELPDASDLVGLRTPSAGLATLQRAEPSAAIEPLAENTPPAPEHQKEKTRGWFGLGRVAVCFIGSMVVAQIGIEALSAAMPALLEKTFSDFSVVTDITITGSLASILGRILGPAIVERFSLKKAYLGALTVKLVSSSVMAGLLATGHMSVLGLAAFYGFNGLLGGVALTAEKSIPPAIVGQDAEKLEKFGAWKQTLLEVMGSLVPIATGAVVASVGFLPALIAFPLTFGISIAILWFTLKVPQKFELLRRADVEQAALLRGAKKSLGSVFKDFWRKIRNGARVVWGNPVLRTTFLAYTAFLVLNPFLYNSLAPAYGVRLMGANNPSSAAVMGLLTGLYSLGGLLGGILMLLEQKRLKRLKEPAPGSGKAPASNEEIAELLRKSMLRWMLWGTVGLAAIATFAWPLPTLGALVALPSFLSWAGNLTLPALVLVPFGIAQVVAMIKLESFFQARTPEADVNDATGFLGSASLAISTLGLVALKFLFSGKLPFGLKPFAFAGLAGFAPFMIVAAAMIPLAAAYLLLRRRLGRVSAGGLQSPPKPS